MIMRLSHKTGIEARRILSSAPFLSSITRINADILNNVENRRNYTRDVAQEAASKRKTDEPYQSEGETRKKGVCAPAQAFPKKTPFSTAAYVKNFTIIFCGSDKKILRRFDIVGGCHHFHQKVKMIYLNSSFYLYKASLLNCAKVLLAGEDKIMR